MTISFPRTLPAVPLYVTAFDLVTMGEDSVTQGGTPLVVETGPSLWKVSFATPGLVGSDARLMAAWLRSIKSPPQPFYAADQRHMLPGAYQGGFGVLTRATGGAFDGTAQLGGVGADNLTPQITTLPAGFKLGPGDMIAFDYNSGASRALHTVVSDQAAADGSGNLTIEVRPVIRAGFSTGATVFLSGAPAKFNLVRDSDKASTNNTNKTIFTFDGMQTLV
jgi:hypothetical protein